MSEKKSDRIFLKMSKKLSKKKNEISNETFFVSQISAFGKNGGFLPP